MEKEFPYASTDDDVLSKGRSVARERYRYDLRMEAASIVQDIKDGKLPPYDFEQRVRAAADSAVLPTESAIGVIQETGNADAIEAGSKQIPESVHVALGLIAHAAYSEDLEEEIESVAKKEGVEIGPESDWAPLRTAPKKTTKPRGRTTGAPYRSSDDRDLQEAEEILVARYQNQLRADANRIASKALRDGMSGCPLIHMVSDATHNAASAAIKADGVSAKIIDVSANFDAADEAGIETSSRVIDALGTIAYMAYLQDLSEHLDDVLAAKGIDASTGYPLKTR